MTTTDLDFDPDVLRAYYREERDRRLRQRGQAERARAAQNGFYGAGPVVFFNLMAS